MNECVHIFFIGYVLFKVLPLQLFKRGKLRVVFFGKMRDLFPTFLCAAEITANRHKADNVIFVGKRVYKFADPRKACAEKLTVPAPIVNLALTESADIDILQTFDKVAVWILMCEIRYKLFANAY